MTRPAEVTKLGNEYADLLGYDLYAPDTVQAAILEEWGILHGNGIVPQKPPKR